MKIMMIDGSPKVSKSNSEYFLNILSDFIESKDIVKYKLSKKVDYEDIIKEINTIDTLVFITFSCFRIFDYARREF